MTNNTAAIGREDFFMMGVLTFAGPVKKEHGQEKIRPMSFDNAAAVVAFSPPAATAGSWLDGARASLDDAAHVEDDLL